MCLPRRQIRGWACFLWSSPRGYITVGDSGSRSSVKESRRSEWSESYAVSEEGFG
jgi:hypothetical protein